MAVEANLSKEHSIFACYCFRGNMILIAVSKETKKTPQIFQHRRTGNFLLGGRGGETFAQKILASCPNFYKTVKKKRGSYDGTNIIRPTCKVEIFLHTNLSYDLIKHVKRNSCLCHFDLQIYLRYDLYHC